MIQMYSGIHIKHYVIYIKYWKKYINNSLNLDNENYKYNNSLELKENATAIKHTQYIQ